jgi:hypothetical protein
MKKIYLTLSAIALSLCSTAQQNFVGQHTGPTTKEKATLTPKTKARVLAPVKNGGLFGINTATANFQGRFDPSYAMPNARGLTLGFAGTEDYQTYVDPLFCDSTTFSSFSSGDNLVDYHLYGWNFDPKSIIYETDNTGSLTYAPLLDATQPYFLDTIWIAGSYKRLPGGVGSPDDTLIVLITYGDTTNTGWANWAFSSGAPATLRAFGRYCTPRFNTTNANGDVLSFVGTNTLKIKHVLTKSDSAYMKDGSGYLPIVPNGASGLLIPADNNFNVSYSFNAGGTHSNGAISFASSTATTPQATSGWASYTWYQEVINFSTLADLMQGYDDFDASKNTATYTWKKPRYQQNATTYMQAGYAWGYWMDFSIHYDVTTKVNEMSKNNFILGQNTPNPFTSGSSVKYTLAKNAKSATFTVTDVTGRIISSENVDTTTGTHSVNLGSHAAGVYYYSLNVDGNVSTKKMIAQ